MDLTTHLAQRSLGCCTHPGPAGLHRKKKLVKRTFPSGTVGCSELWAQLLTFLLETSSVPSRFSSGSSISVDRVGGGKSNLESCDKGRDAIVPEVGDLCVAGSGGAGLTLPWIRAPSFAVSSHTQEKKPTQRDNGVSTRPFRGRDRERRGCLSFLLQPQIDSCWCPHRASLSVNVCARSQESRARAEPPSAV